VHQPSALSISTAKTGDKGEWLVGREGPQRCSIPDGLEGRAKLSQLSARAAVPEVLQVLSNASQPFRMGVGMGGKFVEGLAKHVFVPQMRQQRRSVPQRGVLHGKVFEGGSGELKQSSQLLAAPPARVDQFPRITVGSIELGQRVIELAESYGTKPGVHWL